MFSGIFKKIWFLWTTSLLLNIITLFVVFFKVNGDSGKIIVLHYNVISGGDQFGKAIHLYQLPAAAFFVTALNYIFFKAIRKSGEKIFYAPLAPAVSLVIQLAILFVTVLLVNGY